MVKQKGRAFYKSSRPELGSQYRTVLGRATWRLRPLLQLVPVDCLELEWTFMKRTWEVTYKRKKRALVLRDTVVFSCRSENLFSLTF
jgi:hypothetical protein